MLTHANEHARPSARASKGNVKHRAARWARVVLAAVVPVLGAGVLTSPALAHGGGSRYQFQKIDNGADPTFNQLLGINRNGVIAGYFGSGAMGHPNKGYLLFNRHSQPQYLNENWPQSTQTQVTGLNDNGVTVGFWSTMNTADEMNDNRAFVTYRGLFIDGDFPTDNAASPPVDQLLGVNDRNIAVGFYNDAGGDTHAYKFALRGNRFTEVTPAGLTGPTAAGINNHGDIAGFGTDGTGDSSNGQVVGYLLRPGGQVTILDVPGSSMTQALGINNSREVVGVYAIGTGDAAMTHGFTWTPNGGFQTLVDDPNGQGATTINGLNDRGQLVGFYTDTADNTHGFLATPFGRHRD